MNFEIIPKFKALFETENKPKTFHPTSLKFPQSVTEDYVLFEDLQMKGYRPLQGGLSSPQMEAVLNNLAAFHAASVVEGNINQSVNQRMVKTPNKELQLLNNRIFHEHLRLYDLKDYEDKIKFLQSHFLEESSPSNSLEFQVLQVGNCCIDNMLFLLDAFGNVKDIAFINLDMCCYGNPVKDLLYLLLSSAINADKMNNFDYYIKYYHDQLVGYLKLLKFKRKIPKLWELQYDVIKNNKWVFEAVTQVLPLVLWDPSNSNESNLSEEEELPINDKFLKVMCAQDNYCQQIQKLLPWMEDKAFLEE
uniref:CHK kinase-like domain-containing protein n=1 Tax=Stomoxys calcitrans TaxID=35570 RepID=A0A1I8Q896_STOCA